MIRRILVPTDHSGAASEALTLAAGLAARHEASLILLHVGAHARALPAELTRRAEAAFAHAQGGSEGPAGAPCSLPEFVGRMILDEARQLAAQHGAPRVEAVLDFGDVAERILHHAAHRAVDMIAMGSRGHSDLTGLLLGSVSNKVQHHAPCTSLIVREAEAGSVRTLRTVLAAVDGSPDASKALELASDIAARAGASLAVVHALLHDALPERVREQIDTSTLGEAAREELESGASQAEALRYAALPVPQLPLEVLQEVGRAILARGRAIARAAGLTEVETVLLDGDPAASIVAEAKRREADLIVLGSRGLGTLEALLLGSVSHKVSRLAACPSIVVR